MYIKPATTLLLLFLLAGFSAFSQQQFDTIYKNEYSYDLSEFINYKATYIQNRLYEDAEDIDEDYLITKKSGKYGVYNDSKKSFYAEARYDTITRTGNYLLDGKWGNLLYGEKISELMPEHPRGVVFIKNGKYGAKRISGETILEAQYDEVIPKQYGLFFFRKKDKWGFVNADRDNTLVKPKYDYLIQYTDFDTQYPTITAYSNKAKTRYSIYGKPTGKKQKPAKQERIIKRYNEFAKAYWFGDWKPKTIFFTDGKKNGVKDALGNIIIPAKYDMINPMMDGNYLVSKDTLHGMLGSNGETIIPLLYGGIGPVKGDALKDNLFYVYKQNTTSVFDTKGKQLYPFDMLYSEGAMSIDDYYKKVYFQIVENKILEKGKGLDEYGEPQLSNDIYSKALLLYENGKMTKVLDGCTEINYFAYPSQTLAYRVYGSPLFGFYSQKDGSRIEPKYLKFIPMTEGRILVSTTGEFYDAVLSNDLTAKPLNVKVTDYRNGYFLVNDDGRMQVMDENYNLSKFTQPKIEYLVNLSNTRSLDPLLKAAYSRTFRYFDENGKCGLIDVDGRILFSAGEYDDLTVALRSSDDPYPDAEKLKAAGKYFDRIMVARKYKGNTAETDLYFEGENIAHLNVSRYWQLKYSDITRNGQLILRYPGIRLYNLTTQQVDLETKTDNFSEDADGGFTIVYGHTRHRLEKYSTGGKLLSVDVIAPDKLYGYERSKPAYINNKDGKYALVNVKGEMLSPFVNDTLTTYDYKHYIAKRGNKMGIVTLEGIAIPFEYNAITYYPYNWMNKEQGIYTLKKIGKYGVADTNAQMILPAEYDNATAKGEFIIANKGRAFSVLNRSGKLLFTLECDALEAWSTELLFFIKSGKQGIVRKDGTVLMEPLYKQIEQITKGTYMVTDGDLKYLADEKGKKLLPIALDSANHITSEYKPFDITEDYLVLENMEGKFALYSLTTKELLPFEYDYIDKVENFRYVIAKKNGKMGVVSIENKIIIPFKYDYISFQDEYGSFEAETGKARYLISPNGVILEEEMDDQ